MGKNVGLGGTFVIPFVQISHGAAAQISEVSLYRARDGPLAHVDANQKQFFNTQTRVLTVVTLLEVRISRLRRRVDCFVSIVIASHHLLSLLLLMLLLMLIDR